MKNTKQIILSLLLVSMTGSVIAKECTKQANTEQKTLSSKIKNRVIKGAKITGYTTEALLGSLILGFEAWIFAKNPKVLYKGIFQRRETETCLIYGIGTPVASALLAHGSYGLNKELKIIKHAKAVDEKLQISSRVKALKDKAMTKIRSLRKKESKQEA